MNVALWAIGSTVLVSLVSLVGVVTLMMNKATLKKIVLYLLGFSTGSLMGGAFFHLIPEAAERNSFDVVSMMIIIGFLVFFMIERLLHWHHCHKDTKCDVHIFTHMSIIGDAVHNFLDGLIIAASYIIDLRLGIVTTIAVISHEIPQEIGDFGVLIHGGYSRKKALLFNFLSSVMAIIGAIIGVMLSSVQSVINYIIPFAAGGFIYVFASDLVPELHKEPKISKSLLSSLFFIFGIVFMYLLKMLLEG